MPDPKCVLLDYTNWRGERRLRTVVPVRIYHGPGSQWHPGPQWFLEAYDSEVGDFRDFAMSGIHEWRNADA